MLSISLSLLLGTWVLAVARLAASWRNQELRPALTVEDAATAHLNAA